MPENVQISLGVKADTKQSQQDVTALSRALKELQNVADGIGKGNSIADYGRQIKQAASDIAHISGRAQIAKTFEAFNETPSMANLTKFSNAVQSEYNRTAKEVAAAAKETSASTRRMADSVKSSESPLHNFAKSLMRIAKLRLLRGIIRAITQAFKEGTENIYQYSVAMGSADASHFASTMDGLASSFLYLKNSIGSVVAPLLGSLVPALQTVIGWVSAALNVLAQFFAVLNGQSTYTKAKETATAWKEVGGAVGGAAAAAKEYENTVLGFDELNILNDVPESGGGGGGGGAGSPDFSDMFEEAELATTGIAGAFNRLAKALKPILGGIWDFTKDTIETIFDGFSLAADACVAVFSGDVEEMKRVFDEFGKFVARTPFLKGIYDGMNGVRKFALNLITDIKLWVLDLIEDFVNLPFVSAILETLGFDIEAITGNIENQKRAVQENKEEVGRNITFWKLWSQGVSGATADAIININKASTDGAKAFAGITNSADNTKNKVWDVSNAVKSANNLNPSFSGIINGFNGTANSAWNAYSNAWLLSNQLGQLAQVSLRGITVGINVIKNSLGFAKGGYVNGYANGGMIPSYATGGINSADLFMANENANPELVGRIGSRTAVANQGQMVEALAEGLSRAFANMSEGGTSNIEVVVNMDGVAVARANDRGQRQLNRRFNVQLA